MWDLPCVWQVVVLKALHEDTDLHDYYEKIGFTSQQQAFADEGLADSYAHGEMLFV